MLALDRSDQEWIGKRRRWRVGVLSLIRWIGIISILLAVYQGGLDWLTLLAPLFDQFVGWRPEWLDAKSELVTNFTISRSLVAAAPILMLWWITQWCWRAWNEGEMRTLIQGGSPTRHWSVYLGIFFQLSAATVVVYGTK